MPEFLLYLPHDASVEHCKPSCPLSHSALLIKQKAALAGCSKARHGISFFPIVLVIARHRLCFEFALSELIKSSYIVSLENKVEDSVKSQQILFFFDILGHLNPPKLRVVIGGVF